MYWTMLNARPTENGFTARLTRHLTEAGANFGVWLADLLWGLLCVALIFLGARMLLNLVSRLTRRVMHSQRYHRSEHGGRRMDSIMTLVRSTTRYLIYIGAVLLSLMVLGVGEKVGSLIVTAGIGGVAIGFGAQSFVKDVVTGFFMMFENQFSVGDFVRLDNLEGQVEATALRVTYLRSMKGEQIIIPNGTISRVVNYTRGSYVAQVAVTVPFELDARRVMEVVERSISAWAEEHPEKCVGVPTVRGITALGPYGMEITCACEVQPLMQWEVERGFRLAIKEAFDRVGIPFAYPVQRSSPAPVSEPDYDALWPEAQPLPDADGKTM